MPPVLKKFKRGLRRWLFWGVVVIVWAGVFVLWGKYIIPWWGMPIAIFGGLSIAVLKDKLIIEFHS